MKASTRDEAPHTGKCASPNKADEAIRAIEGVLANSIDRNTTPRKNNSSEKAAVAGNVCT